LEEDAPVIEHQKAASSVNSKDSSQHVLITSVLSTQPNNDDDLSPRPNRNPKYRQSTSRTSIVNAGIRFLQDYTEV
jgi:hypothetical protein